MPLGSSSGDECLWGSKNEAENSSVAVSPSQCDQFLGSAATETIYEREDGRE